MREHSILRFRPQPFFAADDASFPAVHPGGGDLIQVAIVGCGGRGGGAAINALSTPSGPVKVVALADSFSDRLEETYKNLVESGVEGVDTPEERRFAGFDAYKQAMDCLRPGDIVALTTPPAFRWVHFKYAVSKGLNVFMEKPTTVDGPTSKRMLETAEESVTKNLKVGAGLMSRHARNIQELRERVLNGELGEILFMRGYRMHGPGGYFHSGPKPEGIGELEYQLRRFHSFLWASGGAYSDFYIHQIDHLCWIKDALPVSAQALGGRHYKIGPDGAESVDQNFDSYAVEYTFDDGTKMFFDGRSMQGAHNIYSSYVHGTKGMGIAARKYDCSGPSAIFRGQKIAPANAVWRSEDESNPYQNEWDTLLEAIREDKPMNEAKVGIEASLVCSMGRMAAHTAQEITFEQMLNCDHEFAPGLDELTADSPAPVLSDEHGRYPKPEPGIKAREY
ncbi:MAG TPA: Gfo/Idh/MocA family oxidoreductase [Fimbriimonadaceae bacterium]|nr:Gfo/Idh/MocA family oxidoreductase [Fimbriimonadaceae bacterium]